MTVMRLTKLGHACLHLTDGDASVLIDPGAFSGGFEELTGLSAVLITHQHFDHLDPQRIGALLAANPQALVVCDPDTAPQLAEQGIQAQVGTAGTVFDAAGLAIEVFGERHAVIHPDIPGLRNVGYLVGGRFFHPGDSLTVPDKRVEVLGIPTGAPWLKSGEAVDFLRAVNPGVAVPIHDRTLAMPQMEYDRFTSLAPADTEVRVIGDGDSTDLG